MPVATVNIIGLSELRRALRKMDRESVRALNAGLKGAVQPLVPQIAATVPTSTGRARSSVRVTSSGGTVWLKGGGARVPYFGWLDFGGQLPGHRPRRKKAMMWSGAQHPSASAGGAYRTEIRSGRYIYPGAERHAEEATERTAIIFDGVARRAGFY